VKQTHEIHRTVIVTNCVKSLSVSYPISASLQSAAFFTDELCRRLSVFSPPAICERGVFTCSKSRKLHTGYEDLY